MSSLPMMLMFRTFKKHGQQAVVECQDGTTLQRVTVWLKKRVAEQGVVNTVNDQWLIRSPEPDWKGKVPQPYDRFVLPDGRQFAVKNVKIIGAVPGVRIFNLEVSGGYE